MPLVIQDRNFDADNQLVYLGGAPARERGMANGGMMGGTMMRGGMGSMMASMMGVLGDQILVNGGGRAKRDVERRAHRMRLLNASNSRTLKLAWTDGTPLTVIASDGGLLAAPVRRDYVMLAPAERVDLWVDFGRWSPGAEPVLRSLAFEGGIDMGNMMGGSGALADGAAFVVQHFKVGEGPARSETLPQRLSSLVVPQPLAAINHARQKVFELTMGMMVWGINGAGFDMHAASEQETVKLGAQEIWEFRNEGRGSMMGMVMPHSMHVHGLQFRVISRSISAEFEGRQGFM